MSRVDVVFYGVERIEVAKEGWYIPTKEWVSVLLKRLYKWNLLKYHLVPEYSNIKKSVLTLSDDHVEQVRAAVNQLLKSRGSAPDIVLMGDDYFSEVLGTNQVDYYLKFFVSSSPNYLMEAVTKAIGVRVIIVGWMDGILPIYSSMLSTKE